jgi:hypothetical protein
MRKSNLPKVQHTLFYVYVLLDSRFQEERLNWICIHHQANYECSKGANALTKTTIPITLNCDMIYLKCLPKKIFLIKDKENFSVIMQPSEKAPV